MFSAAALDEFIASNPDARELKRALAVKMTLSQYTQGQIMVLLGVTSGFISKWKKQFLAHGVDCLRLAYHGSQSYLSDEVRQQVMAWLGSQRKTSVPELARYLQQQFGVVYQSTQSYYELLAAARYRWKKTQPRNPQADPEQVVATREAIKKTV
jgi:putative transposase